MGNRSLDDFLGGDAGDEATDDESADSTGSDGAGDESAGSGADELADSDVDEAVEPDSDETTVANPAKRDEPVTDAVEPAASTYVARAGECVACGETVRRRWQSEDGPVCPECKVW